MKYYPSDRAIPLQFREVTKLVILLHACQAASVTLCIETTKPLIEFFRSHFSPIRFRDEEINTWAPITAKRRNVRSVRERNHGRVCLEWTSLDKLDMDKTASARVIRAC